MLIDALSRKIVGNRWESGRGAPRTRSAAARHRGAEGQGGARRRRGPYRRPRHAHRMSFDALQQHIVGNRWESGCGAPRTRSAVARGRAARPSTRKFASTDHHRCVPPDASASWSSSRATLTVLDDRAPRDTRRDRRGRERVDSHCGPDAAASAPRSGPLSVARPSPVTNVAAGCWTAAERAFWHAQSPKTAVLSPKIHANMARLSGSLAQLASCQPHCISPNYASGASRLLLGLLAAGQLLFWAKQANFGHLLSTGPLMMMVLRSYSHGVRGTRRRTGPGRTKCCRHARVPGNTTAA